MYKSVNTIRSTALAGIAFVALAATPAYAADTDTLEVSATVTPNCNVSATSVAFGNVNVLAGSNVDATGDLSVTCTVGAAWTVAADVGAAAGATFAVRKMADGVKRLNYTLYTNSGRTTVWGDGVGGTTSVYSGTGDGTAQPSTIYARIPSGQGTVPTGTYADSVTVTVTY